MARRRPDAPDGDHGAADHERAPDHQHGELAEAELLQRPGVGEQEEAAGDERRQHRRRRRAPPARCRWRAPPGRCQDVAPQAALRRAGRARERACRSAPEVVVVVDALPRIRVVVQQVVGRVREQQPDAAGEPAPPVEGLLPSSVTPCSARSPPKAAEEKVITSTAARGAMSQRSGQRRSGPAHGGRGQCVRRAGSSRPARMVPRRCRRATVRRLGVARPPSPVSSRMVPWFAAASRPVTDSLPRS